MTRLKTSDIYDISSRLERYSRDLIAKTGRSLLGIACHTCSVDERLIKERIPSYCIHVVPVTAGLGIISDFCETVCAILRFMGFNAKVSERPDTTGIALAFEKNADAIMMADDYRFVGLNLLDRSVADNSEMTGKVYAAVLDLMAGGIKDKDVLVMGCGPVGEAAARKLLSYHARLTLTDMDSNAAQLLKEKLSHSPKSDKIKILGQTEGLSTHQYILEATPSENTIPDAQLSGDMRIAAPGVPLGVSEKGRQIVKNGLVHDKLELGVAAMAVSLVSKKQKGKVNGK